MRVIHPSPVGPFSEACVIGNMVYTSGMAGCDMQTGEVAGRDAACQARQALVNLQAVLAAAGTDFNHVVKVDLMVRNCSDADAINEIYGEFFQAHRPARRWIFVPDLIAPEFLLEIEMIAEIPTNS